MAQQLAGTYDGLKGFFTDILTGTKSIGEVWQALGKSIMRIIAYMAAEWLASQITMSLFPALTPVKHEAGQRESPDDMLPAAITLVALL